MIKRIQLEVVEDRQLPRWVYAMMKSKEDPSADIEDSADIKRRMEAQIKAKDFYKQRQDRMKEMAEQQGSSSRYSGLEWRTKKPNKFTAKELDKILPTRQASYVASKTFFLTIVGSGVLAATSVTLFIGMAVCAEMKLSGNNTDFSMIAGNAWAMFTASPLAYFYRVINAFDW